MRDQHPRRFFVRAENADRLTGLDKQCLIVLQLAQRTNDRVECLPTPGRSSRAAVNDEMVRVLCNVRIEIVHQHPERGFLVPAFAGPFDSARRADHPSATHFNSSSSKTPSRIAAATAAMSGDMERSASTAGEILRTRS